MPNPSQCKTPLFLASPDTPPRTEQEAITTPAAISPSPVVRPPNLPGAHIPHKNLPPSQSDPSRASSTTHSTNSAQADTDKGLPILRKNRPGPAPMVCKPFEGKVATHGRLSGFVITSPNMNYVPEYPIERSTVNTFADGRWGIREYSRWPQPHVPEMTHVACIPRKPSPPHLPPILWTSLDRTLHWEEDEGVLVRGLGLIKREVREDLNKAAEEAIRRIRTVREPSDKAKEYANFLIMVLRQVIDRMNALRAAPYVAIAVAAHVQRLCLELAGLKTYLEVVVPRLKTHIDYSSSVLPVLGGFLRDGTDAQAWCRIGLPVWLIQPLSHDLAVWEVVDERPVTYDLATALCNPPILHSPGTFVGATNLTGNWLSSMVMSVSKFVSGSHLAHMSLEAVPVLQDGGQGKRPRIDENEIQTRHLAMPGVRSATVQVADTPLTKSQKKRARQKRQKAAGTSIDSCASVGATGQEAQAASSRQEGSYSGHALQASQMQPSRTLVPSPFYDLTPEWSSALAAVSPIPRSSHMALYFFPPPFLLDTICEEGDLPRRCGKYPERARKDTKVLRYLHNLVRIREFCRTRLFDPSLSNRPLSIAEWRAALWGDYQVRASKEDAQSDGATARRQKRRQEDRNGVSVLFKQVAHVPPYTGEEIVRLGDTVVSARDVAQNESIRETLLWEAHEINFRAEVLALDTLLVQTVNWGEIHKWQRENLVSGVWGERSSALSVLPCIETASTSCWYNPPDERATEGRACLRVFAEVLSRWPGCPTDIIDGWNREWSADEFSNIHRKAIDFYVRTFVANFSRLPVPPIPRTLRRINC